MNKGILKISTLLVVVLISANIAQGQILISLLLGDKLNSENIEFGLDGGVNFMSLKGQTPSSTRPGFNLGFYFDFKTKSPFIIHTGVIVKSPMGARDLPTYDLNDPNLNALFTGGEVQRRLRYFNVPAMIKRPFKNRIYVEGGFMFGLLAKSFDEFRQSINKNDDLTHRVYNKSLYHPLDAGLIAGVGYRLTKGKGMNLGVRYYNGLVDITIDDNTKDVFNRSLYLTVGIPMGSQKKDQ